MTRRTYATTSLAGLWPVNACCGGIPALIRRSLCRRATGNDSRDPFSSGELVTGAEPDWSFLRDMATVEFQLENPPRSRTTWILEHEGKIYIPSGYMTTPWGKIWKQWPIEAEQDGRAILRVNGKLYRRQLVRLEDGLAVEPVVKLLAAKYGLGKGASETTTNATALVDSGYLWLFEMAPPRS